MSAAAVPNQLILRAVAEIAIQSSMSACPSSSEERDDKWNQLISLSIGVILCYFVNDVVCVTVCVTV